MQHKPLFLVGAILGILGITGYFALRNAQASPVVAAVKQSESTLTSPASGTFSELARSWNGHRLALVRDNKKVGVLDPRQENSFRIYESSENEWIYGPTFAPDGSLLATVSNTPNLQAAGHLLLWDPETGQRLASVDNLSWLSAAPASTVLERSSLSPETQRFTL
jgi:WD40 repeat protein